MLSKKLLRTAFSYKSQFISMIIMVAIGVGIFLGFNIEWKSLEVDAFAFLDDTNYADFRIYSDVGFTENDVTAIRNIDGVDCATRFFNANVEIKNTKKSVTLNVSEDYTVSTMLITDGTEYDENSDGIWLSDKFADANNIDVSDELTFTYAGIELTGRVVGLAKSGENLICTADENQIMPDYDSFGFAYVTPKSLEKALGTSFYSQINLISDMSKEELEEKIKTATGMTYLVTAKNEHYSYAGVQSEVEEGKTMGSVLPVLFLAIAILTMVTTMQRISSNEKVQIGTLKALGFRDSKILLHYTSYGLFIGVVATVLGVLLGYVVAAIIISPNGMMATYIDMPSWNLVMPVFCVPVIILIPVVLALIDYLSVRKLLKGTAADALRPYTPKTMKKSVIEKLPLFNKLPFGTKWNVRDVLRHKSRSAMTLVGVIGCTVLLVGGLGMKDTMKNFLDTMNSDICKYNTKIIISDTASNETSMAIADNVNGDWQATNGASYNGKSVSLEIYNAEKGRIGFVDEENKPMKIDDNGVYLCLRLKNTAKIGDIVEISPYSSDETYKVRVAGYTRSLVSKCIVLSNKYADSIGMQYHISAVYTDTIAENIENSTAISGKQDKKTIMDSYDTFMEIMNTMIVLLVTAAVVLGVVVLYNLGVMSYVERYRELATLKVLGFRDGVIGRLLISQNIWLTVIGVMIGIPLGVGVLYILILALVGEYEMSVVITGATYLITIVLIFGVSLFVGFMVSRKNKKINMVEALKGAE